MSTEPLQASGRLTPPDFRGTLLKQSPSGVKKMVGKDWEKRVIILRRGCLYYYRDDEKRGEICFAKNPCDLEADQDSTTRFMLKPAGGRWIAGEFTGADGNRIFYFDAVGSIHSRDEWIGSISSHIKFGQSPSIASGYFSPDKPLNLTSDSPCAKTENLKLMTAGSGFDIIIVCTSDAMQAEYWEQHLCKVKGSAIPANSVAVAVDEDWPGGAGNFLGSLYAWRKACSKLKAGLRPLDLLAELASGKSVGLFHTAGKGTRMAPLPASENNNKPGVKLPCPDGPSILECVIRQTGAYASSRKGRLSVFWGDQIFVPSVHVAYEPKYHVDIACMLGPMPTAQEWAERDLDKYGCIAASEDGAVQAMLEKVSFKVASERMSQCNDVQKVGCSLGSFSLSKQFLTQLMETFAEELDSKSTKMDSDPHMWMPMTLSKDAYVDLMVGKGDFAQEQAEKHWSRISTLVSNFEKGSLAMFGTVDVGLKCSWWDYGLLKLYVKNSLLLTGCGEEAQLARFFFGISGMATESMGLKSAVVTRTCKIDEASSVSSSTLLSGIVKSSMVFGVCANVVKLNGAIAINCSAKKLCLEPGAVCYNVFDDSDEGISLGKNEVRVGVWMPGSEMDYFVLNSNWEEIDGGKSFKEKVKGNLSSFQEVYDKNLGVNVVDCARVSAERRSSFTRALQASL